MMRGVMRGDVSLWPALLLLCRPLAPAYTKPGLQTIDFRRQGELFFSEGVRVNYEECDHSFYDEVYEYEEYYHQGIERPNFNIQWYTMTMKESSSRLSESVDVTIEELYYRRGRGRGPSTATGPASPPRPWSRCWGPGCRPAAPCTPTSTTASALAPITRSSRHIHIVYYQGCCPSFILRNILLKR